MYPNIPNAPWYDDEIPRRHRHIPIVDQLFPSSISFPFPICSNLQNTVPLSRAPSATSPLLMPLPQVPQYAGLYLANGSSSNLVPCPSTYRLPTSLPDSFSGVKRDLHESHGNNGKPGTSAKKRCASKTALKPSLQEFTQFILAFTKAHNQGNAGQIVEMLQERFHPKFERVSYRIELPSRKVVEETKLQSFGIQSYMKYLDTLSKLIPDSVFYVGRPFTIANYKKKRNLYVVQCNYSYRGTFILLQNDASSTAAAAAVATTVSITSNSALNQDNNIIGRHVFSSASQNVVALEAVIAQSNNKEQLSGSPCVVASTDGEETAKDSGSSISSNDAAPAGDISQSLVTPDEDIDEDLFDKEGLDFSVVFGEGDELTNLEFICFDDFDFLGDEHVEDMELPGSALIPLVSVGVSTVGNTDSGPQLELPSNIYCGESSQNMLPCETKPVVAPIDTLTSSELQSSALFLLNQIPTVIGDNGTSVTNADCRSGPISSVPFNLSGKLSFYVNKTTHKIVRMEYVYSS